jgi:hypothetical protein
VYQKAHFLPLADLRRIHRYPCFVPDARRSPKSRAGEHGIGVIHLPLEADDLFAFFCPSQVKILSPNASAAAPK